MLRRIALISSLGAVLAGGALTHTAQAAGPQIGVSDDRILLAGGPKAQKMVDEWKRDGVDVVRVFALWRRYAPKPNNRHVPKGFNAADPTSHGYDWFFLDNAVNMVRAAGMKVMLTISGPGPRWATTKAKRNGTYKPKARSFANFAHAVAERYGSQVDTYLLWNEPNSGAFLLPQIKHKQVVSAQTYRGLLRAAYPAVHPYGAKTPPDASPRGADDLNIATLGRLESTLDRLHRLHRVKGPRHMGLYVDEYGYQTNPPDKTSGVSPHKQDLWLQRGAYIAWRNHRIKLLTQYLWYDEPKAHGHYSNWQSGMRYASGRAKPALRHFAVPFALDSARNLLWGQARSGGRQRVTVQIKRRGRSWHTLKRVRTDSHGYWHLKRRLVRGASYRFKAGSRTSSTLKR